MSPRIAFLKGHGTEKDFMIVPDPDADPDNAIDLLAPPPFSPASAYPYGVNVEFVVNQVPGVALGVYERGAETRIERPDGEIEMTGPAVIVAEGEIDAEWLETVNP